ncbi:MAG: chromosome segregation ATPase [Nodosilinea sp.]
MAQHQQTPGQDFNQGPEPAPPEQSPPAASDRLTWAVPPPRADQRPRPQPANPAPSSGYSSLPGVAGQSVSSPNGATPTQTTRYDPLDDLRQKVTGKSSSTGQAMALPASDPAAASDRLSLGKRLLKSWPIWSLAFLVMFSGVGVLSAISLFRIPNLPNCRAIFWLTASATTRLQCANAYADQGTVEGYIDAIALLESLPDDHPLHGEVNQSIETWSEKILDLAENTFQAGQLPEAIAIAQRIPNHTAAAQAINQQVNEWNQIWQEAEAIYAAAETDLKNLEFQDAFNQAIQLLEVGNTYWETTKYEELSTKITTAREDLNELGRAKGLAKQGTLKAMQEAIAIAQGIEGQSPVYAEAQRVLRDFGRDLMTMAETALENRDAVLARQLLDTIPPQLPLGEDVADMRTIIDASQLSWQGGIAGLEGGIVRLQSISNDRPLYGKAQTYIARWQDEIKGRTQLEWARQVALPGTTADLQAAIAEADQVSRANPAWPETQDQIGRWRGQIQTTEDRPILAQAQQTAQAGDLAGAIATARQIAPGRALYAEAQTQISQWRSQIQRTEDAPLLAEAQQLANSGQWADAILIASRIGTGRALYAEAQGNIQTWKAKLQGEQQLQQAYQIAQQGTAAALAEAIRVAQQVSEDSPQKAEANQTATRWSWDLFRLAESEAQINVSRAIEIAALVPPQTEAYAQAQLQIRAWQASLSP